jgi:hypothetical protein
MRLQGVLGEPLLVLREGYRPVFVVGMNGSGTTMLLDSLGRHPQLYSFPQETRVIPHLMATMGQFGDLDADENFLALWNRVRGIPAFRVVNRGQVPPLPANWAEFPRGLDAVLDAMFRYFAAPHAKVRWCEKTPQHVQHLERLSRLFPQAKFIHIIRDGRDCAASFYRRWRRTPELTIYRWKHVVSVGKRQGLALTDRYLELRYEDLTLDPEGGLQRICAFLGLPFHPDLLMFRCRQGQQRGIVGCIEQNTGRWRTDFSVRRLQRLERIAGACLQELGYPVQYHPGSEEPPPWRLRYWKTTDYLRQFGGEFAKKLRGESWKSWSSLLRLPLVAFQQSRANRY